MLYLLAVFCSPLALLLAGKPVSALFNLILYAISIALWATLIFHHAGFLVWLIAFLHAAFAIHDAREDRRVRRMMRAARGD
ncbi:MAG TPA: hypothetical protein VMH86_02170 [Rhizomicrobium sp.]|nr:hypothetical protein [Rhizomicrobium sp.]